MNNLDRPNCQCGMYHKNSTETCFTVMTPKQTELESAEDFAYRLNHPEKLDRSIKSAVEARDLAMIEKWRREERDRAVDICRKYGAVHMIDAMRGGIQ